jgi:hypothetical protein
LHERTDLLPCINCEGDPLACTVHGLGVRVICPSCKRSTGFFEREIEAVDRWNGGRLHRETIERLMARV